MACIGEDTHVSPQIQRKARVRRRPSLAGQQVAHTGACGKAPRSGATEAYGLAYVEGSLTTENVAGDHFQQPASRLNGHVDIRRHTVRAFLVRHAQLEAEGAGI